MRFPFSAIAIARIWPVFGSIETTEPAGSPLRSSVPRIACVASVCIFASSVV